MGLLGGCGRPARDIIYEEVVLNTKSYVIGHVLSNGVVRKFVIDREDYDRVSEYSWHIASNSYICSGIVHDGKHKALYLHNFIMGRDAFQGKGQTESIDHINRNGLDNRKENLRLITQSEQNINQLKKKRNVILPEGCPVKPDDIPRHIWYVRANGQHGDRFAIEFKTEGILWKTTSSKSVGLLTKLAAAKERLAELYQLYPYLDPAKWEEDIKDKTDSYNAIVALSSV